MAVDPNNRINLALYLDGKQAATSLEDFKELVRQGKQELEGLSVGSEQYNRIASAVATANTQIKSQEKLIKGLTSEEIGMAYARMGAGISSTFAASTAALQMFGIESDGVLKAAANAQNLLTIAISTRQIQEGLLSAKMLSNIVAEKARTAAAALGATTQNANTAATVAGTAALEADTVATVAQTGAQTGLNVVTAAGTNIMRIFYATVAANPFGAILVLVGLLVTAVIGLKSVLTEATTAQEALNKKVAEGMGDVKQQQVEIETLASIVRDETKSQEERRGALEQLKKLVPSLADVEIEHADAITRVNEAVGVQIPLIRAKAEAEAAAAILSEKLKEIAIAQAEGLDRYNWSLRTIVNSYSPTSRFYSMVNQMTEEQIKLTGEANEATIQYKAALDKYNAEYSKSLTLEKQNTEQKNKAIRATKDQELAYKALMRELKSINDLLEDQIKFYNDLADVYQAEDRIPKLVEETNKALEERSKVIEKANVGIAQSLKNLGYLINETTGDFEDLYSSAPPQDVFGKSIENFRSALVKLINDGNLVQASLYIREFQNYAVALKGQEFIDQSQLDSILELGDNYENVIKILEAFPSINEVLGQEFLPKYLQSVRELKLVSGEIGYEYDRQNNIIKKSTTEGIILTKSRKDAQDAELDLLTKLTAEYNNQAKTNLEAFLDRAEIAKSEKKIILDQFKTLKEGSVEQAALLEETSRKIAQARLDALKVNVDAIIEEENQIRGFFYQIQQGTIENAKLSRDTVAGLLTANLKQTRDFVKGQIEISRDTAEQFFADIETLSPTQMAEKYGQQFLQVQQMLAEKGLSMFELTEEEKLKILKYYLEQQQSEEEKAERAAERRRRKMAREFQTYIQLLTQGIQNYLNVAALQEELALERLAINNKKILDSITGDNEEANNKRVEQTKEYEAQVAAIQKKARIRQLRGDQVQAASNVALGVTRAFTEGTIVGAISAAIITATGLAQIATIQQQINLAQSMKKGGIIRGQNGMMISGPSHENGGVMMNGGYNLEGGEAVVNRSSSRQYQGLLSTINMANGGRPLMMSQFDDSRIVEAIARQRSEPIRAYVVEQEITKKQGITKRLEQLSKF